MAVDVDVDIDVDVDVGIGIDGGIGVGIGVGISVGDPGLLTGAIAGAVADTGGGGIAVADNDARNTDDIDDVTLFWMEDDMTVGARKD